VVLARFEGHAATSEFIVPFAPAADLAGWQDQNFIDQHARAKFQELGLSPAPLCDDAQFLRRAYLDAIGTLPTVEETQAFLASTDPHKRSALVDRLLGLSADPAQNIYQDAYAAYWTLKWSDLIRVSSDNLGEQGLWSLHNWLKEAFRVDRPFDQMVKELITARGSAYMNGPANYFRIGADAAEQAEATAQLFLGIRLQCAKCHHHPFEKYSQADYYQFAAFFARVGRKSSQEFGIFGGEQAVVVQSGGEMTHPRTGAVMKPTALDGPELDDPLDRRRPLADWLTAPDNRWFSRNVVNRYVAYLLGHGLVEPVDDLRATNPASNPALLEALADHFVAEGYSIRKLMRTIMQSRLYQLDSQPNEANAADTRFYSHYKVKRLAAEPLLDAIDRVTGVPTKFQNMPLGTRAIELPDSNYQDYFLVTFGKPRRVSVCECERTPDENLAQALHTLNGDILATKLSTPTGRVGRLMAAGRGHDEIVTELYLAALCREPTAQERQAIAELKQESAQPQAFYEDLLWTILNSKQFLFVE